MKTVAMALGAQAQAECVAQGQSGTGPNQGQAHLFVTQAQAFLDEPALQAEIFGATALLVTCDSDEQMRQVADVTVPAGKDLTFAPSAYHVMLLQPKDRSLLSEGKRFPLTLHFEKAGDITVEVAVQKQPPGDQPAVHEHAH